MFDQREEQPVSTVSDQTCPSKVAWPYAQDEWVNVTCSRPLGHTDPRRHEGVVRGFARGQQQAIDVTISWTRPPDASEDVPS
jgi:hypothetical protein